MTKISALDGISMSAMRDLIEADPLSCWFGVSDEYIGPVDILFC